MIVSKSVLDGVFEEFKGIFSTSYSNYELGWDAKTLSMYVPTNTISVTYNWLESLPLTRKWVGDKVIKNVGASSYVVSSEMFENTLGVFKRDLEADNIGIYRPMIQAMAAEARHHINRVMASAITNASNTVCFDGQYLCDTDHPGASGTSSTWTNLATTALSASALTFYIGQMRGWQDAEGRVIGIRPTHLVVPLELEGTATELLTSTVKVGANNATVNVLQGGLQLVVIPELTNASAWFLIDMSKGVGPFIYQERKAPTFVSVDDASDSRVFLSGEYLYGTEADYTIQPGFPQTIFASYA